MYADEPVCGFESYGGVVNDPYLSGGVVTEGVVGDGVIMGEYPAGSSIQGTVLPDNFEPAQGYRSNKFDTDGAQNHQRRAVAAWSRAGQLVSHPTGRNDDSDAVSEYDRFKT